MTPPFTIGGIPRSVFVEIHRTFARSLAQAKPGTPPAIPQFLKELGGLLEGRRGLDETLRNACRSAAESFATHDWNDPSKGKMWLGAARLFETPPPSSEPAIDPRRTVYALSHPRLIGHIEIKMRRSLLSSQHIGHLYLLDYAGILSICGDSNTGHMKATGHLIAPSFADEIRRLIPLPEEKKVLLISDPKEEKFRRFMKKIDDSSMTRFLQNHPDPTLAGRFRDRFVSPGIFDADDPDPFFYSALYILDDEELLKAIGFRPAMLVPPTVLVRSQDLADLPFPELARGKEAPPVTAIAAPKEAREHTIYTLKHPRMIGRIQVKNRKLGRVGDIYLVDFAGLLAILMDNWLLHVGVGGRPTPSIVDPRFADRIRGLIPPPEKKSLLNLNDPSMFPSKVHEITNLCIDADKHDDPGVIKGLRSRLLHFIDIDPKSPEPFAGTRLHVLNDFDLLTRLGFRREKVMPPTAFSESHDVTGLPFPALSETRVEKTAPPTPAGAPEEVLFQTHRFRKIKESEYHSTYRVGGLLALFDKRDSSLHIFDVNVTSSVAAGDLAPARAKQSLVLFRRGNRFIRWDEIPPGERPEMLEDESFRNLPEAEIELTDTPYPGQDPLEIARLRLPLTQALTEVTGIPHEIHLDLKFIGNIPRTDSEIEWRGYAAGPLLVVESEIQGGGGSTYCMVYDTRSARNVSGEKAAATAEKAPMLLFRDPSQPGLFRHHSLFPDEDRGRLEQAIRSWHRQFRPLPRFNANAQGIELVTTGGEVRGGQLRIRPTDDLREYLLLDSEEEPSVPKEIRLSIAPPSLKETDPIGPLLSEDRPENPIRTTGMTGREPYTPETWFTAGEFGLQLPKIRPSDLQEGDLLSIRTKDFGIFPYRLVRKRRGEFFLVDDRQDRVGTLLVNGNRLTLQIGNKFTMEGEIPQRETVRGIEISGKGGPGELGIFLDHLARTMGDRQGYSDTLRKAAASLARLPVPDMAELVPAALSLYRADIQFSFTSSTEWTLKVLRIDETPDSAITDFLEAAGEANDWILHRPAEPSPVAPEAGQEPHPYRQIDVAHNFTDGSSLSGQMKTRALDSFLLALNLNWGGQKIPLPITSAHRWTRYRVTDEGVREVKSGEVVLNWKGISLPAGSPDVSVSRDLTVSITEEGIRQATWIEHREYPLPTGGKISVDLDPASLAAGKTLDLRFDRSETGLPRHYKLRVKEIPDPSDLSPDLVQVQEVDLPFGAGPLKIVWERDGDNIHLYSPDRSFTVPSRIEPFGTVDVPCILRMIDGRWAVESPLEVGEDSSGFRWVGLPTKEGYRLHHPVPLLIREGEPATVRFGGSEFRLVLENGRINPKRLTPAQTPAGYAPLGDAELPVSLRTGGFGPSLPMPLEEVMRFTADLTALIADLHPDEILYPTWESILKMIEIARAGQPGEAALRFVGSRSPLLFEEGFRYVPENPLRWIPSGIDEALQVVDHASTWNGQVRPTIYLQPEVTSHEWVPVPPGSTRFFSVPIPGRAGLFAIINATGCIPGELALRRRAARAGFDRYLHAEEAGLTDRTGTYSGPAEWVIDKNDLGLCTLTGGPGKMTFTAWVDRTNLRLLFPDGRTELTVESDGEKTKGYYQTFRHRRSGHLLFIQIDPKEGRSPRLFRATFLPGTDPLFAEVTDDLSHPPADLGWIQTEGWVGAEEKQKQPGAEPAGTKERTRRPVSPFYAVAEGGPTIEVEGDLPEAGTDLLPYQMNERDWTGLATYSDREIAPEQVRWLESWLTLGGSDFQLLPESILEFRRAREELNQTRPENIDSFHPVFLWLMNGNGTRIQIALRPHLPRPGSKPVWVFDHNGKTNKGVRLRFVGHHPETGRWIQVLTPATYDRTPQGQSLTVFDPIGLTGVLQRLQLVSDEGSGLFALYDATEREKPGSAEAEANLNWLSPRRRRSLALSRLTWLAGFVQEAEETFVVEGPHEQFRWTLREYEERGEGERTGKMIQIRCPLEGGTIRLSKKMRLRWHDPVDEQGVWHEEEFDLYRTRDRGVLLVHPEKRSLRYLLAFDPSGRPFLRIVRDFETGLADFYSPPRWTLAYNVDRVRSERETTGLARVEEATSEYRRTGTCPEGHRVHRYFFHVDELGAVTHFDLLLGPDGKPVRIFEDSWEIEGAKTELDRSAVKMETAPLDGGGIRLHLRHRPRSYRDAVRRTHFLTVDLRPDPETPETGGFLGHGVTILQVHYERISQNPRRQFLPSETRERFSYIKRDEEVGGRVYTEGYLTAQTAPDSRQGQRFNLVFYDPAAASRRELEFVLEKDGEGRWAKLQSGTVRLFNFHTGKAIPISAVGKITVTTPVNSDDGAFDLVLDWRPFRLRFFLDADGNIPPQRRDTPFEFTFQTGRGAEAREVRDLATLTPDAIDRGKKLFEQTYGLPDSPLPGQKWRARKAVAADWRVVRVVYGSDVEIGLRQAWLQACILLCSRGPVAEPLTADAVRELERLADRVVALDRSGITTGGRAAAATREATSFEAATESSAAAQAEMEGRLDAGHAEKVGKFFEGPFPLSETPFGLAIIKGLRTYTRLSDSGEIETHVDEFTEALLNAALSLYREKNEITAGMLEGLMIAAAEMEGVDDEILEEVLYSAVNERIFRNRERLKAYRDYALVLPHIGSEMQQRVLRVLRRPNIGEAERQLLETLVETHFKENSSHPVRRWRELHPRPFD